MIVEDAFEGESVEPAGFSDVLDSIGAEDVEGAAAQPGEDAWIDANATSILGHGDVADVVGTSRIPSFFHHRTCRAWSWFRRGFGSIEAGAWTWGRRFGGAGV